MDYDAIGFVDGYNNNKSKFEYVCNIHGNHLVSYEPFVRRHHRCSGCVKDENIQRLREYGNGNGYYPERKDEQDYLYVLNFNDEFIKIGRSFEIENRIKGLCNISKIKKIYILKVFTATHQEVYDYEQELLSKLRTDFQYYCGWSTEILLNHVLPTLNRLLDNTCNFKEITLEEF